jgi:UPF0288 family protein (methanogenesis marker protein 3)
MTDKTKLPAVPSGIPGELSTDEKWGELKRHLVENIKWYREQQQNPKADSFFFFMRENCETDILDYIMYLDGKDTDETKLLIALLGKPAAYTVPPTPGRDK